MKKATHPLLGSIAALCLFGTAANAQEHTWIAPTTGVWSNSANWLGGGTPPAGGGSTLGLKFAPVAAPVGDIDSANDLSGNFLLNALEFEVPIASRLLVSTPLSNTLVFAGTNSRITQSGPGSIVLSGMFDAADGITTVNGSGSGEITFTSLAGLSTGDTLRIAVGPDSPNGQLVSATTDATGGTIQLDSGNLSLKLGVNFGNTNLRINGGTVRFDTSSSSTLNSAIELGGSLLLVNPSNATIASAITSVVPNAGLHLSARSSLSNLTLTAASTYTGPTIVDLGLTATTYTTPGATLRLSGNGSLLNTSEFDIQAGTLAIETSPTGVTNRVGDATPVTLRSGRLVIEAPTKSGMVQSEQIGPVSVSGYSGITIGTAGQSIDLIADSLTRSNRGTILFSSPTLASPGATPARILFNTPPTLVGGGGTGKMTSIIPYAIGNDTGLVTYDPVKGVRLLTTTEYSSSLPIFGEPAASSNLRLTTSASISQDSAINALLLVDSGYISSFDKTLTVVSGTVVSTGLSKTISTDLNFDSAEGQIFTISNLTIFGKISGNGGLTKSGGGILTLTDSSTFTGPLTINGGTLNFRSMAHLGGDTAPVVLSNSALQYAGSALNFNRPLEVLAGYATLETTSSSLEFSQPISGLGGLRIIGSSNDITGTRGVRLSGVNTYNGPTVVTAGTLEFANDSALGSGELWIDATVKLLGNWTTNRGVRILGGTLNTNGFDATLNGDLVGTDALAKTGAGTLALTKSSTFSGPITISAGTVALSEQATIRSSTINAGTGTSLVLDETGTKGGRLAVNSVVTLSGAKLRMVGDAVHFSNEKIGTLALAANTSNTLELARPGTSSLSFTANNFTSNGSELIVKADTLGGASGSPNTRLIFENPPATTTGILPRIYSVPPDVGQESLTKYETASDTEGPIGVRPLTAAEYTTGSGLQHSDGVANFLVEPGTTALGTNNFVKTLTFQSGGSLTQSEGQGLVLDDQMLVRSGVPSSFTGGSLKAGTLMAFGDITLETTIVGPMEKIGPGTLILGSQPDNTAAITIGSGPWRPASPLALAQQTIGMDSRAAVLNLDGTNASIGALNGTGTLDLGGGTLTVGTNGSDFTFNGRLPTSGQLVIVDGGNPNALRTLTVSTSTNNGSVTLQSGRLIYEHSGVVVPLNLAGGVLEFSTRTVTDITLNLIGNAVVRGENSLRLISSTSVLSGPGTVTFEGFNEINIEGPTTHTGEIVVSGDVTAITIKESRGALRTESAIRLNGNQLRVFYEAGNSDRIGDNTAIHINGGSAYFKGPISNTAVEYCGPIFAYPGAELVLETDTATQLLDIRPASLNRVNGGVLKIDAPTLGAGAPGRLEIHPQNQLTVVGGAAAVGPNTSIVPWIVGAGKTFVAADSTAGLRMLNPDTDFAQGLAAVSSPTNNLNLAGVQTLNNPLTVNSLRLTDATNFANLRGSEPLTVTSGAIMAAGSFAAIVETPILLNSAEGIVSSYGGDLWFRGPISGDGGLTIAGPGPVTLGAINTFTGSLRVLGGSLRFEKSDSLGPDASPVLLNGTSLLYTGSGDATLTRPIEMTTFGGIIGNGASQGLLTIQSPISGPGSLTITGQDLLLTGSNPFQGDLRINASGIIRFTTDAALGGGALTLGGGTLEPTFNWTTNRKIYPDSNATVSTGAFSVEWNGPILGFGELRKSGSGTLIVRDADEYSGHVRLREGTLIIEGSLGGDTESQVSGDPGTKLIGNGNWNRDVRLQGTLAPGPATAELTISQLEFWPSSSLELQIISASNYDRLVVGGVLKFDQTVDLTLALDYDPVDFVDVFTIVRPATLQLVQGAPPELFRYLGNPLSEGEKFLVGTQEFQISYTAGDGNDITIYAVPEPSSALIAAVALSSFMGLRRRRPHRPRPTDKSRPPCDCPHGLQRWNHRSHSEHGN